MPVVREGRAASAAPGNIAAASAAVSAAEAAAVVEKNGSRRWAARSR